MNAYLPPELRPLALAAQEHAQALLRDVAGLTAVVVASADGFSLASACKGTVDAERVAAMASSISAVGAVVGQETGLGTPTHILLQSEQGHASVYSFTCRHHALVLIAVAQAETVFAQLHYRVSRLAREWARDSYVLPAAPTPP